MTYKDPPGLYRVPDTRAETLFTISKDLFIRCNVPVTLCCGQGYDGAANMQCRRSGVTTQFLEENLLQYQCTAVLTPWICTCRMLAENWPALGMHWNFARKLSTSFDSHQRYFHQTFKLVVVELHRNHCAQHDGQLALQPLMPSSKTTFYLWKL